MALKRFLKGASIYAGAGVVTKAMSLLITPIYTRYLSVEDFGAVALAESAATVLATCVGLSLPAAVSRQYFKHEDPETRARFVSTLLSASFGLSAVAFGGLLFVGPLVVSTLPAWWSVAFFPIVALALANAFSRGHLAVWNRLFQAAEKPLHFAVINLSLAGLTGAAVLILVVGLGEGGPGLLGGRLLGTACVLCGVVVVFRGRLRPKPSRALLVSAIRFSAPLVPYQLMVLVLEASDRFVIEAYLGSERVGVYTLAAILGGVMIFVNRSVLAAWQPVFFSRVKTEPGRAELGRDAPRIVILSSAVATVGALISNDVVAIAFDPRYAEAGALVPWLLGGFLLWKVFALSNLQVLQTERGSLSSAITVVVGALNIGLNLWSVPIWGIRAAAIATFASYAVQAGLGLVIGQWIRPIPYAWGRGAVGLLVFGAGLCVTQWSWSTVVEGRIARGLVFALVLASLAFAWRGERPSAPP